MCFCVCPDFLKLTWIQSGHTKKTIWAGRLKKARELENEMKHHIWFWSFLLFNDQFVLLNWLFACKNLYFQIISLCTHHIHILISNVWHYFIKCCPWYLLPFCTLLQLKTLQLWHPQASTPAETGNTEEFSKTLMTAQYVYYHVSRGWLSWQTPGVNSRAGAGGLLWTTSSSGDLIFALRMQWKFKSYTVYRLVCEGIEAPTALRLSFSDEGAVNDSTPACQFYLFIRLWYLCVVSVLAACRCYMKHFSIKAPSVSFFNINTESNDALSSENSHINKSGKNHHPALQPIVLDSYLSGGHKHNSNWMLTLSADWWAKMAATSICI